MSPSLYSISHSNTIMYDDIVQKTLNLLGLSMRSQYKKYKEKEVTAVSLRSLTVYPETCNSDLCKNTCEPDICRLCVPCLSANIVRNLARTYLEYVNRGSYKRIFPPKLVSIANTRFVSIVTEP